MSSERELVRVFNKSAGRFVATYKGEDAEELIKEAKADGYVGEIYAYDVPTNMDLSTTVITDVIRVLGITTVTELARATGESTQNLNNWFLKKRIRFDLILQGMIYAAFIGPQLDMEEFRREGAYLYFKSLFEDARAYRMAASDLEERAESYSHSSFEDVPDYVSEDVPDYVPEDDMDKVGKLHDENVQLRNALSNKLDEVEEMHNRAEERISHLEKMMNDVEKVRKELYARVKKEESKNVKEK